MPEETNWIVDLRPSGARAVTVRNPHQHTIHARAHVHMMLQAADLFCVAVSAERCRNAGARRRAHCIESALDHAREYCCRHIVCRVLCRPCLRIPPPPPPHCLHQAISSIQQYCCRQCLHWERCRH